MQERARERGIEGQKRKYEEKGHVQELWKPKARKKQHMNRDLSTMDMMGEPMELIGLHRQVKYALQQETMEATKRGDKLPFHLAVRDLDLDADDLLQPPVVRSELIESWRILVDTIKGCEILFDYVPSLDSAFREVDKIDAAEHRHLRTLVDLLTQTVENSHRDRNLIRCRFATLLEIMLSYGPDWERSEQLQQAWTGITQQQIQKELAPASFRRKAYRVLVSLSWVPSSKGLLGACSFDEEKQRIDFSQVPSNVIRSQVERIEGREPRPRYDLVNQMLDRLKDETDVCVAITSEKEGMGKTTLAAQVASHPSIQRVFTVLWLSTTCPKGGDMSEHGNLTYAQYTTYLDGLCEQIKVKQEWPEVVRRFEEPGLRRIREEELMLEAKVMMAGILAERDTNVLLILDDVLDSSFVEWFRFSERQSVVVTTRLPDLDDVDCTIEVEGISEGEAIELFLLEGNLPKNHLLGATVELRSIAKQCEYNPLAIRSIAKFFLLKKVTAGPVQAIEEIITDLEGLAKTPDLDEEDDPNMLLFDVLSLMMGPTRKDLDATSVLFILCFAAFVVVFPNRAPLGEVLLLWEEVLKLEPHAIDELSTDGSSKSANGLKKQAWLIGEGLLHMGVIVISGDQENPWVETHHHLYKEFATLMAVELGLKGSLEETIIEWNTAFVAAYFSQRIQAETGSVDSNSWEYAIENLPMHMLKGKMLSAAESVLAEENFFRARVEAIGWRRAMKVQVSDCVDLQRALDMKEGGSHLYPSAVFKQTAEMTRQHAKAMSGAEASSVSDEIARVLLDLGLAQAETGYYTESLKLLEDAQNLFSESHPLRASVLYGAGWAYLHANETKNALQSIKACRDAMDQDSSLHVLYKDMLQLVGNALVAECEYKEGAEFYKLICEKMKMNAESSRVELGCTLYSKARLHHTMGELAQAEEVYKECVQWKEDIGERSKSLAMAYASLGDLYLETDRVDDAKTSYGIALDYMNDLTFDTDDLDYHLLRGKFTFARGDYYGFTSVFAMVQQSIGEKPALVLDKSAFDLRSMALIYKSRGDLEKATQLLHESLVLTLGRPFSLERAAGLTHLGNALLAQGDPSEGLNCLEKAMEIEIIKLGESAKVVESLKDIGNVHLSLHAYDDALTVFRKLYEVTERVHAGDIKKLGEVMFSMAEVLYAKKDYEEATLHFTLCKDLLQSNGSSHSTDIANALHRLGDVSLSQENLDKAYDYYSQACEMRKSESDKLSLAETQHCLGVVARKRGELETAQELLLEALEIRRTSEDARKTGETLLEIGNIYRLQRELDGAISIYEKGLEVVDEDDELAVSLDFALGHASLANGDHPDALERYTRVREKRVAVFGRDDMRTGVTCRSLGLAHFLLNQAEDSLVHFNEFVRVCEHQGEDASETIDYAMAVLLLGDIHVCKGNKDQARSVWGVAQEVCEDNGFEKSHPDFVDLISRRLERNGKGKKGFFRRGSKDDDALVTDAKDVKVLQSLVFLDDC